MEDENLIRLLREVQRYNYGMNGEDYMVLAWADDASFLKFCQRAETVIPLSYLPVPKKAVLPWTPSFPPKKNIAEWRRLYQHFKAKEDSWLKRCGFYEEFKEYFGKLEEEGFYKFFNREFGE